MEQIEGYVGNIKYIIDLKVVEELKNLGIDAIEEMEIALRKVIDEDKGVE